MRICCAGVPVSPARQWTEAGLWEAGAKLISRIDYLDRAGKVILFGPSDPAFRRLEVELQARYASVVVPLELEGLQGELAADADLLVLGRGVERKTVEGLLSRVGAEFPVLVLVRPENAGSQVELVRAGASDCVVYAGEPGDAALVAHRARVVIRNRRLRERVAAVEEWAEAEQDSVHVLVKHVIPLGIALNRESKFGALLERTLLDAMTVCNADAGTFYLRTDEDELKFAIVRTNSLGIGMGGTSGNAITLPPIPLFNQENSEPNERNMAAFAAVRRKVVNVPDVYSEAAFDVSGAKAFDKATGYRSTSVLSVPILNAKKHTIGVLQLLNAIDPDSGAVTAFDQRHQLLIEAFAILAATGIEGWRREEQLRDEVRKLKVEIDQKQKAEQVEAIADSDYFKRLQDKAHELRRRAGKE